MENEEVTKTSFLCSYFVSVLVLMMGLEFLTSSADLVLVMGLDQMWL